ncbi:hypothetical protein KM043_000138, partial [Ampulex compressa]
MDEGASKGKREEPVEERGARMEQGRGEGPGKGGIIRSAFFQRRSNSRQAERSGLTMALLSSNDYTY